MDRLGLSSSMFMSLGTGRRDGSWLARAVICAWNFPRAIGCYSRGTMRATRSNSISRWRLFRLGRCSSKTARRSTLVNFTKTAPPTIRVDLIGRTFGELTVIGFVERKSYGRTVLYRRTIWMCRCSCGALHDADHGNLQSGRTTRCPLCHNVQVGQSNRSHGLYRNRVYIAWRRACKREFPDFDVFRDYMGDFPEGEDVWLWRKDSRKPHGPGNTVWANRDQRRRLLAERHARELGLEDEDQIVRLMSISRERMRHFRNRKAGCCMRCGEPKTEDRRDKNLCSLCQQGR